MQCSACKLSTTRRCITEGTGIQNFRPQVLFILESPTAAGEVFGKPLAKNEEQFLSRLYHDAMRMSDIIRPSYWVISMVLCRATDEKRGPNRAPDREEVLACMPNITKLVSKIQPKAVVFMSRLIEKFYKKEFRDAVYMMPPELLLKQGGTVAPYYSTSVRTLSQVLTKVQEERVPQ